jgi:sirohydrochlorin ferrochelatase
VTLVLVAHGTEDPTGVRAVYELAELVAARVPVEVAFADVCAPTLAEVLRRVCRPVIVPAFLAAGYHVRVDLPAQAPGVPITPHLGPAPAMIAALHDRVVGAGWRGGPIVLAAAGSGNPLARNEVRRAAMLLGRVTGVPVRIGYVTGRPGLAEVVRPGDAVASWLLAPGRFHSAVRTCGARLVSDPLGAHPRIADLVVRRYLEARCYGIAA